MSADYKSVIFNGSEAFAVARAMRGRIDAMTSMEAEAITLGRADLAQYSREQVRAAESALAELNAVPLLPVTSEMLAGGKSTYIRKYLQKGGATAAPAPARIQFDNTELWIVRNLLESFVSCIPLLDETNFAKAAQCALAKVKASEVTRSHGGVD